ncbi:MAG: transposase family protein [bacterium]
MSKTKEKTKLKQMEREKKIQGKPRITYNEKRKRFEIPNRKSEHKTSEEEQMERQETIEESVKVYRNMLPILLNRLKKIKDPRQMSKVKHKLTVLMVYGILNFVLQYTSRRKVNTEMTQPIFFENLKRLFPELETMPHADSLERLLARIDVNEIQESLIDLFNDLIRSKKFRKYLYQNRYLFAFDGTQKLSRDEKWAEECSSKTFNKGKEDEYTIYYAYVLECVFIMDNGVTLPLYSEFIDNKEHKSESNKQDTERNAFKRLAQKIKSRFPRLKISVTMDGLSCCGPILRLCRQFSWEFMITFKEGCMPEVWKEALGLIKYTQENRLQCKWGERHQKYSWINEVEHNFGENERLAEIVNVAICEESWEEISQKTKQAKQMSTRYVWVSSTPLTRKNIFDRCTKIGRPRWCIENNFLVLKHHGYSYEHCFSYTWNAMVGYHYLMNIGRFMNVIVSNSDWIFDKVMEKGISGFLKFQRDALKACKLDYKRIDDIVNERHYLKLYVA